MADEPSETPNDEPSIGVEFFAYDPDVTERIERWAEERGVRILRTVPVYFEDAHDARQRPQ